MARYFNAYGGWSAVFGSPLFMLAAIVTGLNYSQWLQENWVDTTIALIPSLLGFSLGTYAILFSLINNRLKGALRAKKNEQGISLLEVVNASFFHFIFVQVLALMWAFVYSGSSLYDLTKLLSTSYSSAHPIFEGLKTAGSFVGYLLLIYSFLLIIAASLVVYRLALIRDPADEAPSPGTVAPNQHSDISES
jgi:hypothetical protein